MIISRMKNAKDIYSSAKNEIVKSHNQFEFKRQFSSGESEGVTTTDQDGPMVKSEPLCAKMNDEQHQIGRSFERICQIEFCDP